MNDNDGDERYISDLFEAPDREAERWRIEAFAGRDREKWGEDDEVDDRPFGLSRRLHGPFWIAAKLADLQSQYDESPDPATGQRLGLRALFLIWPGMIDRDEFYARPKRPHSERKDRQRSNFWLSIAGYLASKHISADNQLYSLPRLTLRHRTPSEKTADNREQRIEASRDGVAEAVRRVRHYGHSYRRCQGRG